MNTRQKQKRQDETRQPAQTPIADAIAFGTAAGGLVLATMQAQAATPEAQGAVDTTQGIEVADKAATAPTAVESSVSGPVESAKASAPTPDIVHHVAAPSINPVSLQSPVPVALQEQLVHELSQQMAGTISKVIEGVEPGMSAADFSQSISSDIIQSAQEIVARLDIGALLSETRGLGDTILAQIDPASIIDGVLGSTAGLADTVLTQVGDLPAEILGNTVGALADLPSSLLGNEGPEGSGGLLSELFYADGGGDSLSIPDLSTAASSLIADIGEGPGGLLALSYTDVSDPQGGHGLNALSLL